MTERLNSPDPKTRASAFRELKERSKTDRSKKEFSAAILGALKNKDESIRLFAVQTVGNIGPDAAGTIPLLNQALKENREPLASSAQAALVKIGSASVPVLIEDLKDKNDPVNHRASEALIQMSSFSVLALMQMWKEEESHEDSAAGETLGKIAVMEPQKIVPYLQDEDSRFVGSVSDFLVAVGSPSVASLIDVLTDPLLRSHAGAAAVQTLSKIGTPAVPALVGTLKSSDAVTRSYSATALGNMGPSAADAVPVLVQNAVSSDQDRDESSALVKIGSASVPALIQILKGTDKEAKLRAINILAQLGPRAHEAMPEVNAILNDSDPRLRGAAEQTMKRIKRKAGKR